MLVFLDFEASSLGKRSYPIEVAWVFEDGRSSTHLIQPAPDWEDWDPAAEAIHRIPHDLLLREGEPHELVARAMVDALSNHDLFASAPSWDGKWLSALLRAAGLPRHSLRLRDSDITCRETAAAVLEGAVPSASLGAIVEDLLVTTVASTDHARTHRALADARAEHARWLAVRAAAMALRNELAARG